jgi:hypothetical protein
VGAAVDRRVRSADGFIPWHEPEDHRFSIVEMREWREAEEVAGRPSAIDDFYAARGLCNDCGSNGARMIGWSKPANEIDTKAAEEFGIAELPLYETCPTCN